MTRMFTFLLVGLALLPAPHASGQDRVPVQGGGAAEPADDPDLDMNPSQPDFTIVTLPTTLRVPRFRSAFRVTHRFSRPLGAGDVGDLAGDLFGLDSGGQIGLEYRFGLLRGLQIGVHRTSERTIQLFGHYNLLQQREGVPLGLSLVLSTDGTNNFRDRYSPAVGMVLSTELGRYGALYLHPTWVGNASAGSAVAVEDDDTFLVGAGARLRVRPTVYVVAEIAPRFGFDQDAHHASVGVEKRAGGHSFQVNFSNGFGTTPGQIARGGTSNDDWYLGFNISRKFF